MTFKGWLLENGHDDGEYPSQNYYSSEEWDQLYNLYTEECGSVFDH